ncbi:MAG TPA: hydroxymethylglutaryl-CoA lyase, partial [Ilumatobacteraceae bacterium]|nr:hydroxymethylglutaryl-CoA lyase [Ilumatobacteraceae bacterium]
IRDCGPRDGLQGESPLDVDVRLRLALDLAAAGVRDVEAAAFVSPRAVPSMTGAAEIVAQLPDDGTNWWVLVPNLRGAEMAVAAGASRITVTVSASPVYSEKNVHMTIDDSLAQIAEIRTVAAEATIDVVVSCAFGSSFGDRVTVADVAGVSTRLRELGADQVTLADTTGTATPRRIQLVLAETGTEVGLHLHDTRATALTNAIAAYQLGVRRFDTGVGGIGGSPFAPGAGGNLATEDLVLMLEDIGVPTGIDLSALIDVSRGLGRVLGRELPSRVARAGPLPEFAE